MTPSFAQSEGAKELEEVIVSARRKDESLQDVPVTVNVVSSEMLAELNILRLEDLQEVVAGLELEDRAVGPLASLRGVRFDAFASGNNPSVEFYLNDVLISANIAMQSMFDVGGIEVLRGPQGTLRGRAAPSGSITMTAKRPNLERVTGNFDVSATDQGGEDYNAGISFPIVKDKLGVRLAGFSQENRGNYVKSFRTGERARLESEGYRVSVRFEPTETLSFNAYHQDLSTDRWQFSHIESANIVDPGLPDSPMHIKDTDRLSAQVPSQLIARRPDVVIAERNVAAANAAIGVATAAWLPSIGISASGSAQGESFSDLWNAPVHFWSLGPSLTQTLFDGGKRSASLDITRARYDESVAVYRQTVLDSLRDVENALASSAILSERSGQQTRLVELAEENERLITNRYKSGLVSFLEVAAAQNTTLNARRGLVNVRAGRLSASAELAAAIGGGWEVGDEVVVTTTSESSNN